MSELKAQNLNEVVSDYRIKWAQQLSEINGVLFAI
jgi:hypothetical protein